MEIKTIKTRLDNADNFDKLVNEALREGFALKERYILEGRDLGNGVYAHNMLIAEMIKDQEPKAPICRPLEFEVSLDMSKAKEQISEIFKETQGIQVKYFEPDLEQIQKISVGDWIDLRAAERVDMKKGDYYLIRLGVGMILPEGYEALVLPRSSTPNKFGIILANSMGVIDNSYSGDADEWRFPAVAIRDTVIEKGDRIAQFRIIENQPSLSFEVVSHLREESRGGIGSTGKR